MDLRLIRTLPAWAALAAGLFATGYAALEVKAGIEGDAVRRFAFTADQIALATRERLASYALILKGAAGLFAGGHDVDRRHWKAYTDTLRANDSVPGVQGIGYTRLIAPGQLGAHEAALRSEGFADYAVRPPGPRGIYTAIVFLEPFSGRNLRAFGYDMFSEPTRRAAMERARDSGAAALSGRVELVQETGQDVQAGTLLYVPVYREGAPTHSVDARRAALIGWTYSPYRMRDLMEGILPGWTSHEGRAIDLHIHDGPEPAAERLLFDSRPDGRHDGRSALHQRRIIDFGGRQWLMEIDATEGTAAADYTGVWFTLAGGVALSALLCGLLLSLAHTKARARAIALDLTEELRSREASLTESEGRFRSLADTAPVLIWMVGTDMHCDWFNQRWLDFTGRTLAQEAGQGWAEGLHPDDRERCLTSFTEAFDARQAFAMEYRLRRADGEFRWLIDHGVPRFDDRGGFTGFIGSCMDITERKQADARWRFAIDGAGDGLWDWDVPGGKVFFSSAWKSMLGHADDEIGNGLDEWSRRVHPDDLPGVMTQVQAHLEGRTPVYASEHRVRCRNGSWKWVLDRGLAIERDAQGRATRVIGTHTDVTERKQAEAELDRHRHHLEELVSRRTAELAQARDAAEAASLAKSIFLANMSHELRTPMNGIMGTIEVLRRRVQDPRQIAWLDMGMRSARHLLGVINDVLDISKIESDRLTLEETGFSLAQTVDEVLQLQEMSLSAKNLRLTREIGPGLPDRLRGDPLRVRQILLNFTGNAIKFSEQGRIHVRVSRLDAPPPEVLLRLEVTDQGIGLSAEQQVRLFRPFVQGDETTTRRHGGTGLGLTIAKRLAQLMGGNVGVVSAPGVGSTFWATIRLRQDGEAPSPEPAATDDPPRERVARDFAGARILLAEDDPINREVVTTLLEDAGLVVVGVPDGAQAVEQAARGRFALVLMDVQMPVMSGLDAARAIRALPQGAALPILALTANAFDDDRRRCLDAGMNDHIRKPVEGRALFASLLRALVAAAALPAAERI